MNLPDQILKLHAKLKPLSITIPQYLCLHILRGAERMSDLAKQMQHTTAATTGMVDRLEAMKLVKRGFDPGDRRVITVCATDRGIALLNQIEEAAQ